MRIGKVKESILRRSVLKQVNWERRFHNGVIDGSGKCVYIEVHPVEGWTLAAPRAVYGAVNAVAARGAIPHAIALTILMPEGTEENQLKALMKEMNRLCEKERVSLIAGHTAVSPAVNTLVLSVTGIGLLPDRLGGCHTDRPGVNQADIPLGYFTDQSAENLMDFSGMDILMVGHAGREGAALLAIEKEEELSSRYARSYIETARYFYDDAGLTDVAQGLFNMGALKVFAVREGGVFGALWDFASSLHTGLRVDLKRIPIRQHTIEICEFFNLNPYMLLSGGCLLAICPDGEKMVQKLDMDLPVRVIGRTTAGNDRLIQYDNETRYLEPAKMDEIYKERI